MTTYTLTAPCNFGLEAILSRELKSLGFEIIETTDGRVNFLADEAGICRANLWLRTAERVLIRFGSFRAESFEELFQGVKALPWEEVLPQSAEFPVIKASSIKSKLYSPRDLQSITKKAVAERMGAAYGLLRLPESGARYPIIVQMNKDIAAIYLESSGLGLHKRGYRLKQNIAPLRETIAAAMVSLTPWHTDRILVDPLCGSGTILIEAAMIGINKAPGLMRRFLAESWDFIKEEDWRQARDQARELIKREADFRLAGYDIDPHVIRYARENARLAGVHEHLHLQQADVRDFSHSGKYGFILCNPPYGERLEDRESVAALYRDMRKAFDRLPTWSYSIITSYSGFEKCWGKPADRRRKIYNGMLKANLYQYQGPKPPQK